MGPKVIKFQDYEVDGIDMRDAPRFCDAFVASATAVLSDGTERPATESECEELTQDGDLMSDLTTDYCASAGDWEYERSRE